MKNIELKEICVDISVQLPREECGVEERKECRHEPREIVVQRKGLIIRINQIDINVCSDVTPQWLRSAALTRRWSALTNVSQILQRKFSSNFDSYFEHKSLSISFNIIIIFKYLKHKALAVVDM